MVKNLIDDTEPVKISIDGTLDLHHFHPKDIKDLLNEYFIECIKEQIYSVRIIHGKGKGVIKNRVQSVLGSHPKVSSYTQSASGNWGATIVELVETD